MGYTSTFWQIGGDDNSLLISQFRQWKSIIKNNIKDFLSTIQEGFDATSYQTLLNDNVIFKHFAAAEKEIFNRDNTLREWFQVYAEYQLLKIYLATLKQTTAGTLITLLEESQEQLISSQHNLNNEETTANLADLKKQISDMTHRSHSFFNENDYLNLDALIIRQTNLNKWLQANAPYKPISLPEPGTEIEMTDFAKCKPFGYKKIG